MHIFIKEHKYFRGYEYDWGAVDQKGQLACFSSGGFGPIPQFCNERSNEDEFNFLDAIFERPIVTEFIQVSDFDVNPEDSLEVARRGFFSYDWCHTYKGYKLIAFPEKPLLRKDINDDLINEFLVTEFGWVFDTEHKSGLKLQGIEIQ